MARFRCRDCKQEGEFDYTGVHECPRCGSREVQFALSIAELPDDDPLVRAIEKLAETAEEDEEDRS
jgi:hypothetical protein